RDLAGGSTPMATRSYLYRRHSLPVRVMHWINVVCLTCLLMSGLMVFNAHPSLGWGKSSYNGQPPLLEITSRNDAGGRPVGVLRIGSREFDTTGVLGVSRNPDGRTGRIAFPSWMTIPAWYSLA